MSAIVILYVVMIHQSWIKKIPAEYGEVVQQKDFVLKTSAAAVDLRYLKVEVAD